MHKLKWIVMSKSIYDIQMDRSVWVSSGGRLVRRTASSDVLERVLADFQVLVHEHGRHTFAQFCTI